MKQTSGKLTIDTMKSQMEIVDLSLGAWRSQVLYVGVKTGLFEALASESMTLEQLSEEIKCPKHSLERLLVAALAVGLLEREGDQYQNSKNVQDTLIPGKPGYSGNWIRLMAHWYNAWCGLESSVRTGENFEDPNLHLGENEEYTQDFIMGMHDYANYRGTDILDHLDLSDSKRLIDVGGGPATYSVLFASANPDLHCTVFDLPDVLKIASQVVNDSDVADRIELTPGNYYKDEFGNDYDVVFLSDMLHQEDAETGMMILKKAFRALRPGGRVVIQAMFLRDDKSGPEWPALHNLLMLLIYKGGKAYSVSETIPWLEDAGFVNIEPVQMRVFNVNSLIVGYKPK